LTSIGECPQLFDLAHVYYFIGGCYGGVMAHEEDKCPLACISMLEEGLMWHIACTYDGGWEFGIEELSPWATLYIIFANFMKDWRDSIYLM
jgi:hypothetical protein